MHSRIIIAFLVLCALHVVAQPASAQIHYGSGYHKVPPGTRSFYSGLGGSYNFYSGLYSTKYRYGTKYYYPSTTTTYLKHATSSVPTHVYIPRYTTLTPTRIYPTPYYRSHKRLYGTHYGYRGVIYSTTPGVGKGVYIPTYP